MNVALIMFDIPDLTGGGGAERFFIDFYNDYRSQLHPNNQLYLITDSVENFEKVGKKVNREGLLLINNYRFADFKITIFFNRRPSFFLGNFILFIRVYKMLRSKKIKIIHIPLYHNREYWFYWFLTRLSWKYRPKLIFNVVDCRLPFWYFKNPAETGQDYKGVYEDFFKKIRIDSVFTWYNSVKYFFQENKLISSCPEVIVAQSRYTTANPIETLSGKENTIVYAARLDKQKAPLFYIKAVEHLCKHHPEVHKHWKFKLYGKGPLEGQVNEYILSNKLDNILKIEEESVLLNALKKSKCFISTQDFENFPSLAITEAMAMGNVIIARNVGQTNWLVKNEVNGFLPHKDTPESMAECIYRFTQSKDYDQMANQSLRLIKEFHNFRNFQEQVDQLWKRVGSR